MTTISTGNVEQAIKLDPAIPGAPEGVMPLVESIPLAAAAITEARTIVMACHVNPDGDALGSMLGLAIALKTLGKDLTVISADGIPEIYRYLPALDIVKATSDTPSF